jgi:hypothetical protein
MRVNTPPPRNVRTALNLHLNPPLRVADIQPARLPIPRPRRHPGRLPPIDPASGGDHSLVLSGPTDLHGDLLQDAAAAPEHPVDNLHRRQRQHRGGNDVDIEPVRQARDACYALREFVAAGPRWTQGRLRWDHVVALPYTKLPADFDLPDFPRWKVIDCTDLPQLADRLRHDLIRQELDHPLLTDTGIEQLRTVLSGRGLPQRDVVARALEIDDAADILTERQAVILNAARSLHRSEVRGGAGSGKTFLAMKQARRLAAGRQRVALVCYSHGLASYFGRVTSRWPRRQQPGYVGDFHTLGMLWGAARGPAGAERTDATIQFWDDDTVQFWEHDLPRQMAELAAGTRTRPSFRFGVDRRGTRFRRCVVGSGPRVATRRRGGRIVRVQR